MVFIFIKGLSLFLLKICKSILRSEAAQAARAAKSFKSKIKTKILFFFMVRVFCLSRGFC